MTIYYKATNMDGKDFFSNTVQFTVGESVPPLPEVLGPECCSSDVYHASTHPESTLIGGFWPCRLFEVEGIPVAEENQKRGFYTFKVVREIEAWRALGPQGREIVTFLERCSRLTVDEAESLEAAWVPTQVPGSDCRAAWRAANDALWTAARGSGRRHAWSACEDALWDATLAIARGAAACKVAIGALCFRDLISEEHFNALYGPWASVIDSE